MGGARSLFLAWLLGAFSLAAPALGAQQNSGAIGQIMPRGGIVTLTGNPGAVVTSVRVRPGDAVKAGDLLMTLGSDALYAERDLARSERQAAQKAHDSEAVAQNLSVELARLRLQEATHQLNTYRSLGDRATSTNEAARLEAAEAQASVSLKIEQARQEAAKAVGGKALESTAKRLALANAAMEIRAPSDGTVLKIDRRVGQMLGGQPAIQIGDLTVMYVVSQVYVGDLLRLRPGMKATIKSATLPKPIAGTVEEITRIVETESRLGEVRIKLDSVDPANRLIGMEVEVVIAP